MLTGPEKASILEDYENLFENNMINLRDSHHDEGQASKMRFKQYVGLLARGWEDICKPFEEECPHLLNIQGVSDKCDQFRLYITGAFFPQFC